MRLINADELKKECRSIPDPKGRYAELKIIEDYEIDDASTIFDIPDNPTNGNVIKAMFPNAEYKHVKTMSGIDGMEVKGINGLYDNFGHWCAEDIFFHDDWWNAPYK